jgi:hypothetical protein
MPPGDVAFGYDQAKPLGVGMDVQEAHRQVILMNDMGRGSPGHDIAKDALFIRHGKSP